jgi:hypothetical protein
MKTKFQAFAFSILLGLLSVQFGCSDEKLVTRFPVHGTVKMASGERLNGSITFLPAKGLSGPSATTKVAEGKYEFDSTNGPAAGPHDVIVRRLITRAASLKAIKDKQPLRENGAQWTLSADVADDGQYLKDFNIDK